MSFDTRKYSLTSRIRSKSIRTARAIKDKLRGPRKNPKIKLPAQWTSGQFRVDEKGRVQIKVNPAKLGSGGRFAKCVKSVEARGGAYDPQAVCASAGMRKYGKKRMEGWAQSEKRRANPKKALGYALIHNGQVIATYSNREAARLSRTSIFGHLKGVRLKKITR